MINYSVQVTRTVLDKVHKYRSCEGGERLTDRRYGLIVTRHYASAEAGFGFRVCVLRLQ